MIFFVIPGLWVVIFRNSPESILISSLPQSIVVLLCCAVCPTKVSAVQTSQNTGNFFRHQWDLKWGLSRSALIVIFDVSPDSFGFYVSIKLFTGYTLLKTMVESFAVRVHLFLH